MSWALYRFHEPYADGMTAPQQPRVRPSFTSHASRRNITPQAVEEGQGERRAEGAAAERNIQELEEIRRYEDFTTIDWVQDAAKEQMRRRARRKANAGLVKRAGRWGIRHRIWQMYDAGQAWIVVTLVGAAIGLDAAFLNIATEWLSDIKRGHCTTAFYLNEKFCCWGEDGRIELAQQAVWADGCRVRRVAAVDWILSVGLVHLPSLFCKLYRLRFVGHN